MKTLPLLFLLLIATLWLPTPGHARLPRGTDMTGVVQSVDHSKRQIVLERADGRAQTFVYTANATFWHGGQDSSPAALKAGMRVRVRVHNPLIGPDFVRQIELVAVSGPSAK